MWEEREISADELENMLMAFMGIYAVSRVLMKAKMGGESVLLYSTMHISSKSIANFQFTINQFGSLINAARKLIEFYAQFMC